MKTLFNHEQVIRTLRRMTHEILERELALDKVVLIGIKNSGVPIAEIISNNLKSFEKINVPVYALDISGYRDDVKISEYEKLDVDLSGRHVILVDDVLYTGRTVRAAMDAVVDLGRPDKIALAVLIDRGHRELPIRADYVGKNIPTRLQEKVIVDVKENKGVILYNPEEDTHGNH